MAYAPSTARTRRAPEDIELELLPFMNLMTLLIPFLLMSASFVHLAVVGASLPAIARQVPGAPPVEGLELKLAVTEHSFVLRGNGFLDGALETDGEFVADFANLDDLAQAAAGLKERWPAESSFIIASDDGVPWERLIAAMDAMRELEGADGERTTLFENPVFAGGLSSSAASQ